MPEQQIKQDYFDVEIYSHFYKIINIGHLGNRIISEFSRSFCMWGPVRLPGGKYRSEIIRVFAAADAKRKEYRFHINTLEDFKILIRNKLSDPTVINFITIPLHTPAKLDVKFKSIYSLKEHQVPAYNFIIDDELNNGSANSKLLQFDTGRGKTATSCASVATIDERVMVIIKPSFIDKWVGDITKWLDNVEGKILCVSGGDQVRGLIGMCEDGSIEKYKFILLSNKTMQIFISDYEKDTDYFKEVYGINSPEELFSITKCGVRLIDEVHMGIHMNFRFDLYTHIHKCISLSATYIGANDFVKEMLLIAFPKKSRYEETAPNKHIRMHPVFFNFQNPYKIRINEYGSNTYSHNAYEKSLMRDYKVLRDYFSMIKQLLHDSYMIDYVKGNKARVYCSSILLISKLTEYLKGEFPNLDVRRYVEQDPYENMIEADICVTTIGSGGTAIDVDQLTCCLLTVNIDSEIANRQTMGRLRKIEGKDVRFLYLVANIDKHKRTHLAKVEMLKPRVASIQEVYFPRILGR